MNCIPKARYSWPIDTTCYQACFNNVGELLRNLVRANKNDISDDHHRYYVTRIDARFLIWKMLRNLGLVWQYNQFYKWVSTNQSLQELVRGTGFTVEERLLLCEICPPVNQCPDAGYEYLVAGRRE